MKGREGKGPPSADLLVCFPSRSHLSLMPKPICSPARPSEPSTRHHQHRHRQRHHMRKSSINRGGGGGGGGGHASPLLWAKSKNHNSDISEPTSPKVTCAGQIKVRPKPSSCKNWQSVMEEIERLHNNRKQKKRSAWVEALGFKKEVMQFLTCLRNIRFDFRCFGAFPAAEITSDDDDDEDDDEDEDDEESYRKSGSKEDNDHDESRAVFSKWFMILQENQGKEFITREESEGKNTRPCSADHQDDEVPSAPPPNALLLMRCRSAPAKSWLEEKAEMEEKDDGKEPEKQNLVVMRCGADFSKFSSDIAKETWVVGGIKDMLSRSRSSKR